MESLPMTATIQTAASADDQRLLESLRAGDEAAFEMLIERYHSSLLRIAMLYVPSRAVAEEVVQETWLGVLQGLANFEGRSSLKTWIFRILTNRAQTRGQREGRSIPFSAVGNPAADAAESAVEPDRFSPIERGGTGHWVSLPRDWDALPEERLISQETRAHIQQAIDALPGSQHEVITLRDVEGWGSEEVCNILGISESNQRVLLHRARSKVRRALEQYLDGT
jgi:RNA polymerase sigma-70 factor, ECF subfamily